MYSAAVITTMPFNSVRVVEFPEHPRRNIPNTSAERHKCSMQIVTDARPQTVLHVFISHSKYINANMSE